MLEHSWLAMLDYFLGIFCCLSQVVSNPLVTPCPPGCSVHGVFLLQGTFLQMSDQTPPCLLHWQEDVLPLSHLGSPVSGIHQSNSGSSFFKHGYGACGETVSERELRTRNLEKMGLSQTCLWPSTWPGHLTSVSFHFFPQVGGLISTPLPVRDAVRMEMRWNSKNYKGLCKLALLLSKKYYY